ncbi:MAG TPA: hypothetical protein VNK89_10235 [Thermoflexus sp.]|nr:hypothetical protein [Thermoflexus sp.]
MGASILRSLKEKHAAVCWELPAPFHHGSFPAVRIVKPNPERGRPYARRERVAVTHPISLAPWIREGQPTSHWPIGLID